MEKQARRMKKDECVQTPQGPAYVTTTQTGDGLTTITTQTKEPVGEQRPGYIRPVTVKEGPTLKLNKRAHVVILPAFPFGTEGA